MADNVAITAGAGTTVAADDVGGVLFQRVKLGLGADGTAVDAVAGSGVNGTGVQRVTIATDDVIVASTNTKLDTLHADIIATNAQLPTTLGATTAAASLSVTRATNDLGLYTEDVAAAADPVGGVLLAVRRDTLSATEVSADGDNVALKATAKGQLHVYEDEVVVAGTAAGNTVLTNHPILLDSFNSFIVQVTSVGGGCTISFQFSNDGVTYTAGLGVPVGNSGSSGPVSTATAVGQWKFPKLGRYFQALVSGYTSGTPAATTLLCKASVGGTGSVNVPNTLTVQGAAAHDAVISSAPNRIAGRAVTANYTPVATGDTADIITTTVGALIEKPFSIPELDWTSPAGASGIVNTTTAVTIKNASGNAAIRSYITGIQYYNATLGAATELAIRDGAGGTVLWRTSIGTTIGRENITFVTPLRSTLNTLLEVVTLTAVTGAVYFNAQGYDAS